MNKSNISWNKKMEESLPFEHSMTVDALAWIILILAVLAVAVNLPVTLSLLKSWKKLLFSDVLLLQIFTSNMLLGIGYTLPIYGYFAKKPIMSMKDSCNFTGYYVYATALLNIGALQILSIHQYIIIKRPLLGYRIKSRKDIGVYACMLIMVVSLLLPLPPLLGWSNYVFILDGFTCELDFYSDSISNKSYCALSAVFAYFIPLINMVYCGSHCVFFRMSRGDSIRNRKSKRPLNKKERKLTQSIFAMFLGFMITWSPYAIICFFTFANAEVNDALHIVCIMFAKSSTIICSLIYFFSYKGSDNIRYTYIVNLCNLFCRTCRRKKENLLIVINGEQQQLRRRIQDETNV